MQTRFQNLPKPAKEALCILNLVALEHFRITEPADVLPVSLGIYVPLVALPPLDSSVAQDPEALLCRAACLKASDTADATPAGTIAFHTAHDIARRRLLNPGQLRRSHLCP